MIFRKMVKDKYQKGAKEENKLKKYLEKKGYYVMRSAGSKGPADLIAIDPETRKIRVIQVKKQKDLNASEINKAYKKMEFIEEGIYDLRKELL